MTDTDEARRSDPVPAIPTLVAAAILVLAVLGTGRLAALPHDSADQGFELTMGFSAVVLFITSIITVIFLVCLEIVLHKTRASAKMWAMVIGAIGFAAVLALGVMVPTLGTVAFLPHGLPLFALGTGLLVGGPKTRSSRVAAALVAVAGLIVTVFGFYIIVA